MSVNKYANLPDIDTAPDVYETEDVFPTSTLNGDSSDEEPSAGLSRIRGRPAGDAGAAGREELDDSPLMDTDEARKKFRKADRKHRHRTIYSYPRSNTPSPSSSRTPSPTRSRPHPSRLPLATRLRLLQSELTALEGELADPSNPKLKTEGVDPGEMIRGLVDVKARIEAVRRGREGRGRLVGVLTDDAEEVNVPEDSESKDSENHENQKEIQGKLDINGVVEMDKRVGELEKLVGSASTTLDETAPLPPALLPLLTRINGQLTLLTQPRHIDSISRRLKLLLSDLERVSAASAAQAQKRVNGTVTGTIGSHDNLLPLLTRLAPSLPHIPHILIRLRTLSALHASAGEFQGTITNLEDEQRRTREALDALNEAITQVESSLEANKSTVAGNVKGLEDRIETVVMRLEDLAT